MGTTWWTLRVTVCLIFAAVVAVCAIDKANSATPTLDEVTYKPKRTVGFLRKTLETGGRSKRTYQVWVPHAYTPRKKWPVILFLHGPDECGTDGEKMLTQGLPKEIKKRGGKFGFVVVIPQCASRKTGWRGHEEQVAIATLQATINEYSCDTDKLYLTGASMGGQGTYALAMDYPTAFAAIAPISAGGNASRAKQIAHLPIWVWQGDADKTPLVESSRKMVAALKRINPRQIKYTELAGVGQNAWAQAYADDALWRWLLEQRRPDYEAMGADQTVPENGDFRPMGKDKFKARFEKGKFKPMGKDEFTPLR